MSKNSQIFYGGFCITKTIEVFFLTLNYCLLLVTQGGICGNIRHGLIPDPSNCARFYNCSTGLMNPLSQECQYPSLFSIIRRACVNFESVQCGVRYEPQSPCKFYKRFLN